MLAQFLCSLTNRSFKVFFLKVLLYVIAFFSFANHFFALGWSQILSEEGEQFSRLRDAQNFPCDRPWPKINLFLPVNVMPSIREWGEVGHAKTFNEWNDIFLPSFLVFWPLKLSQTRVYLMIDEDANTTYIERFYSTLNSTLSKVSDVPDELCKVVTNNFESSYYNNQGPFRMQLIEYHADLYLPNDTEYIGFVDGDTYFTTYVDREDLFEEGKPIVRPRFGNFHGVLYMRPAEWILGGVSDPAVCMSYFPVLIKRSHIKEMREYIERIHSMKMAKVFQIWLGKFNADISIVDVMCTFIWNFHRDEYSWHGYDISLPETRYFSASKMFLRSNFTYEMTLPRPHVANHLVYHDNLGSLEELFFRGICHGPPFPKADKTFENWCNKFNDNDDHIDREFVIYLHQFEHRNSDTEQKKEYLYAYDKYRQQKLVNCTHTYASKIMDFSAIKTHLKPRYYRPNQAIPIFPFNFTA